MTSETKIKLFNQLGSVVNDLYNELTINADGTGGNYTTSEVGEALMIWLRGCAIDGPETDVLNDPLMLAIQNKMYDFILN